MQNALETLFFITIKELLVYAERQYRDGKFKGN